MIIKMFQKVGEFAENKEVAKRLRQEQILPALAQGKEVVMDFAGVDGATQSFIHALVSDPIRQYGGVAFDKLFYKNANKETRKIISIVYRYMQESLDEEL